MAEPKQEAGYVHLYTKEGELFRMPRGGDVNVYLRKGYTVEPPAKPPEGEGAGAGVALSPGLKAADAIAAIEAMATVEEIIGFTQGETRKTVQEAAEDRAAVLRAQE